VDPRPTALEDMEKAVNRQWDVLTITAVQKLYASMPRRVQLYVKGRGHPIKF
jgi:hypothetical protein